MANCTKCGKQLRVDNTKGLCGDSVACNGRVGKAEDAVLEKLEPESREVARQVLKNKRPKPAEAPPATEAAGPDWQKQFFQLAEALGLNPEEMLTEFCQGWVERTRARALAETPVGE